jgi:hypothetical protein
LGGWRLALGTPCVLGVLLLGVWVLLVLVLVLVWVLRVLWLWTLGVGLGWWLGVLILLRGVLVLLLGVVLLGWVLLGWVLLCRVVVGGSYSSWGVGMAGMLLGAASLHCGCDPPLVEPGS